MPSTAPRLSLVVAACNNMGIGINGKLPWRLKGDMAFFRKLTLKTESADTCNAVIMGRKTWDSIPQKFRPLPKRVNVIISRNLPLHGDESPASEEGNVHVARGLDEALELLSNERRTELKLPLIENVFIIGGTSIYEMALKSKYFYRLYLTRVMEDFECDAFLPHIDYTDCKHLREVNEPDVPTDIQEDNGIKYKYCIYQKFVDNTSVPDLLHFSGNHDTDGNVKIHVYVSAAVDSNQGFGVNGTLPWQGLKTEYNHFIDLVTKTTASDKKVVFIKGRRTWEDTTPHERGQPNVINIIVSKSMLQEKLHPDLVYKVVESVDAAIRTAQELYSEGKVEKAWVMGGLDVFKVSQPAYVMLNSSNDNYALECATHAEVIDRELCDRIYLTHIKKTYSCDVFFPSYQQNFKEVSDLRTEAVDDASGIEMSYAVYERVCRQN